CPALSLILAEFGLIEEGAPNVAMLKVSVHLNRHPQTGVDTKHWGILVMCLTAAQILVGINNKNPKSDIRG
ncbi:hypothetical protein ACQP3C_24865, partial [Escherichia coli]